MKIGFIADIHEDIIRLKEAIAILKKKRCDKIVCLGDFVGYSVPYYGFLKSRNGHEVISLIKKECDLVVLGNHELYIIKKLPKYRGFNYPKNWYKLDYLKRKELAKGKVYLYENNELSPLLTNDDMKYIKKLPEYLIVNFDGIKILLSHWTYPDFSGSSTFNPEKPSDFAEHFQFMKKNKCNLSIQGHDHKRVMSFNTKKMQEHSFNTKIKLGDEPLGIYCPCVANGSFANGVMILDTTNKEIEIIPLKTPVHKIPSWKKL